MKAKTAGLLLGLTAAIFECAWIIACLASLYFFAIGQWLSLAGALVAGVAANWLAWRFKGLVDYGENQQRTGPEQLVECDLKDTVKFFRWRTKK